MLLIGRQHLYSATIGALANSQPLSRVFFNQIRFDELIGVNGAANAQEPTSAEREELGALCNAAKYVAAEAAFALLEDVTTRSSWVDLRFPYLARACLYLAEGGVGRKT